MLTVYNDSVPFKVHIEITDQCNARCPQCPRNIITPSKILKENPNLANSWITYDQYVKIFEGHEDNISQVLFSGNFGDPVYNPDFAEILKHTTENLIHKKRKQVPKKYTKSGTGIMRGHVKTCTNGGFRKPEWWAQLAKDTKPKTDQYDNVMCFALDGLEDTHHLYRVNTRFDRVIENAKAWIDAGGIAEWQFIQFEHNKHQVDEARQMAKDLGFVMFQLVTSSRTSIEEYKHKDKSYFIKVPEHNKEFKKAEKEFFAEKQKPVRNKTKRIVEYDEEINCVEADLNRIYIDCEGFVYPCCWIGTHQYHKRNYTRTLYDTGSVLFNKKHREEDKAWNRPFVDILHDGWFEWLLPESWDNEPCTICSQNCGKKTIRTIRETEYNDPRSRT